MNSLFPWFSTFYSKIVENWNENSNKYEKTEVQRFLTLLKFQVVPTRSDGFFNW